METIAFWDIAPCSFVEVYRRFIGALMMEAISNMETSVNFYRTTCRNIPEDFAAKPEISKTTVDSEMKIQVNKCFIKLLREILIVYMSPEKMEKEL
jgi:hypothetical protein